MTLRKIGELLYHLNRRQEAIIHIERAIDALVESGLPQDAVGQTKDEMQQYLYALRQGISLDTANEGPIIMPFDQLQGDSQPAGIGGSIHCFVEPAILVFTETKRRPYTVVRAEYGPGSDMTP